VRENSKVEEKARSTARALETEPSKGKVKAMERPKEMALRAPPMGMVKEMAPERSKVKAPEQSKGMVSETALSKATEMA
jgi:hypothetical protein